MALKPRHDRSIEHNDAEDFWNNLSGNKSEIPTPDQNKFPDSTTSHMTNNRAIPTPSNTSIPNPASTAIPTPSLWNESSGYDKLNEPVGIPNDRQTYNSDPDGGFNSGSAINNSSNNDNVNASGSAIDGSPDRMSNSGFNSGGYESNKTNKTTESEGSDSDRRFSNENDSSNPESDNDLISNGEGDGRHDNASGESTGSESSTSNSSNSSQKINGSASQEDGDPDVEGSEEGGNDAPSGPSIPMPQPVVDSDKDAGDEDAESDTNNASSAGASGSEESSGGSDSTSSSNLNDESSEDGNRSDSNATEGKAEGNQVGQSNVNSSEDGNGKKNDSESKQDSNGNSDSDGNDKSDSGNAQDKKSGSDGKGSKSPKENGDKTSDGDGSGEKKSLGTRIKEAPKNAARAAKDGAKNAVNNSVQAVKDAPKNAVNAAKNGVKNKANALKDQAMDKALGSLNEAKAKAERMKNLAKATAKRTKDIAKKFQHGVKALAHGIRALFSPPGALAAFLVVVMIVTLGCIQTLGPSIIDCDTSNKSTGSSDSSDSSSSSGNSTALGDFKGEVATKVFDFLTKEIGFSGAGAAGALAVAYRESNFQLDAHNPGGGVAGIFQWSGFSNGVNGSRITSEGSIKAGDTSTLTLENQLKLLRYELSNGYRKARDTVGRATDPVQAAKDWSLLYEGVALSDGQSKIDSITQWAGEACDAHNCHSIKADESKLGSSETVNASSDSSSSSTTLKELFCGTNESSGSAMNGSVNGAKQCDQSGCDYSWLCNAMQVCHDGDFGVIPAPYRYQCVWYAWTRAAMVHKGLNSAWSTVQGNGGDIWANAKGRPGWTVTDTPKAGDVISFSTGGAGHVAFVEKVENTGGSWKIYISEGNYNTGGSGAWNGYNTRWLTPDQVKAQAGHFVRHDSWK